MSDIVVLFFAKLMIELFIVLRCTCTMPPQCYRMKYQFWWVASPTIWIPERLLTCRLHVISLDAVNGLTSNAVVVSLDAGRAASNRSFSVGLLSAISRCIYAVYGVKLHLVQVFRRVSACLVIRHSLTARQCEETCVWIISVGLSGVESKCRCDPNPY
jgi:hypothetical protein